MLLVSEDLDLEQSKLYRVLEFEDDLDLERHELHYTPHYIPVTEFSLPEIYQGNIYGSINDLLFLRDESLKPDGLFICNPITRDYIKLNCPQEFVCSDKHAVAYGFGVSKITGKYKVVRISHVSHREGVGQLKVSKPEWQIYTLGTGSWRTPIAPHDPFFVYGGPRPSFLATRNSGLFLNGILHWLVHDINGHLQISCFDLETEACFCLSSPLSRRECFAALCVLGDSLCLCDSAPDAEVVIWSVKEHGDEKFWVKVVVICKTGEFSNFNFMMLTGLLLPLKVYNDGDVLFELDGCYLFFYSKKNKCITFNEFENWHQAVIHTPSFLSLKCFNTENASTF
ncbi:hypothetical protein ACS0TY_028902 [Phlomoides rotata]